MNKKYQILTKMPNSMINNIEKIREITGLNKREIIVIAMKRIIKNNEKYKFND